MASTSSNGIVLEERPLPRPGPRSVVVRRTDSFIPPEHQLKTHQVLLGYVSKTYGTGRTESEKKFIATLNKSGAFSLHLLVIYTFLVWYSSAVVVDTFYSRKVNLTVRCRIPALETCFNFDQILNISLKDQIPTIKNLVSKQYCKYDDHDYRVLILKYGCDFNVIMDKIKNDKTKTRSCHEFVMKNEKPSTSDNAAIHPDSVKEYYQLYCNKDVWNQAFQILHVHGRMFATLLLAAIADMYGRKPVFMISSSLHFMGYLIMLIPSTWCVGLGIILADFNKVAFFSLYELFLETCSNTVMLWMGASVSLVHPVAIIMSYILQHKIQHWLYKHLANTALLLVLPFGIWYITESPRWLMFIGNKPKAWKALMELDSTIEPNQSDLYAPVTKRPNLKKVWGYLYKPIFRKRIIICFLLFFLHSVSCSDGVSDELFITESHTKTTAFYLTSFGFQIVVLALGNLASLRYGRKRMIFIIYCLLTGVNIILFMENQSHSDFALLLMFQILKSLKVAVYFISILYTSEIFPTPCRVTALNICAASRLFGRIVEIHFYEIFNSNSPEVKYMPAFIASAACLLIIYFLPETTKEGLPDTPRDALYFKVLQ